MKKEKFMEFLLQLFLNQAEGGQELDYDGVDDFYAYIGYDLESESLLQSLGIQGTSDLLDELIKAEENL